MEPYKQLWRVVEGSVRDAFNRHPDYLTPKGRKSASVSITKRVTGTVLSFAVQAARSQSSPLAETADRGSLPEPLPGVCAPGGAGVACVSPIFRVRIVNVRRKPRHLREPRKDKRSIQIALERTTRQLAKEMGRAGNA
jgi:hypothetical protein